MIRNVDSQMDEIHINIRKEREKEKEAGTDSDAFGIYLTNTIFFKFGCKMTDFGVWLRDIEILIEVIKKLLHIRCSSLF